MLLHRARVRLSSDDREGAHAELAAALETLPGATEAGRCPAIASSKAADFNWQNHLAYLALAELDDDATRYGDALARSDDFSDREIGAPMSAWGTRDASALLPQAEAIVRGNADPHRRPGPHDGLAIVASPVWERVGGDGAAARRASLVPAKFVELYFEGVAAERLRASGARLAAQAVAEVSIPTLAWRVRAARNVWTSFEAPFAVDLPAYEPAQGLLSAVLADLGRVFRAGATDDEAAARLRGEQPASLDDKLTAFEAWEHEQYMAAMGV
jgi:hypothetical protein